MGSQPSSHHRDAGREYPKKSIPGIPRVFPGALPALAVYVTHSDHAPGFDSRRGLFVRVDRRYNKLTADHSIFSSYSR